MEDKKKKALETWTALCTKHSIDYFAAGKLALAVRGAVGAETLADSDWKIGLKRAEYNKAMGLIRSEGLEREMSELRFAAFDQLPSSHTAGRIYRRLVGTGSARGAKGLAAATLRGRYNRKKDARRVWGADEKKGKVYDIDRLFPTAPTAFEGMTVRMPADPYIWHAKEDPDYLAHVTAKRVQVLRKFDEICKEQQLDYFAIAFLLIAAVVYHDYVPGTEGRNFDVGMPRRDYEAFCAYMRANGEETGLALREFEDDKQKLPLRTKTLSLPGRELTEYIIRVLPFDKVPEDPYMYDGFMEDMEKLNTKAELRKDKKKNMQQADLFAQTFNGDERTDRYQRIALDKSKAIFGKQIYPLQRAKLLDIEICVPADYSVWQPVQDEELERQVKNIQKADLKLLEALDKAAKKLGIGYFVCGGTMLGAVRDGGFIPWDDDIDVGMLREDYERFLREAGDVLGDEFFIQTRESDPNIPYLYSKIRLNGTEYVTEYTSKRDMHQGICLDLFPFDCLPDEPANCQAFIKEVDKLAQEHIVTARYHTREVTGLTEPRTDLEKRYHQEQKEKYDAYRNTDMAQTQKRYLETAQRYNGTMAQRADAIVASFVPSFTWIRKSDLLPYKRAKFENIEVSVPAKAEVFLDMQYGDFTKLPPLHQRTAHKLVRWSTGAAKGGNERA